MFYMGLFNITTNQYYLERGVSSFTEAMMIANFVRNSSFSKELLNRHFVNGSLLSIVNEAGGVQLIKDRYQLILVFEPLVYNSKCVSLSLVDQASLNAVYAIQSGSSITAQIASSDETRTFDPGYATTNVVTDDSHFSFDPVDADSEPLYTTPFPNSFTYNYFLRSGDVCAYGPTSVVSGSELVLGVGDESAVGTVRSCEVQNS